MCFSQPRNLNFLFFSQASRQAFVFFMVSYTFTAYSMPLAVLFCAWAVLLIFIFIHTFAFHLNLQFNFLLELFFSKENSFYLFFFFFFFLQPQHSHIFNLLILSFLYLSAFFSILNLPAFFPYFFP